MSKAILGTVAVLSILGTIALTPDAVGAKERSGEVVSTTVPFEPGRVIPDFEHNIIKFGFVDIFIGDPSPGKDKQKVKLKMKVENFGEKDHKVILTVSLRDQDDRIVASQTVKDDIDDNDSEMFDAKFALPASDVGRIDSVMLEVSYLKD